jgi:hypothetical protein
MNEPKKRAFDEIVAASRRLREDSGFTLSRDQVMEWATTDDLEALGALHFLLFDPEDSRRIEPNLTLAEYMDAELPYLERCLREDPQSQFADSRWEAGGLIANWVKDIWADERFRAAVDQFVHWLARLYKSTDDPDLRTCLVQATIEHLFEVEGIAERFRSWRDDPELKVAYDEAKLWKEGLDELGMEPVDHRQV